jgi:L-lactate dehydrogenase complex protein LldE
MRVALFVTCVVDLLEPEVGMATVRVLSAAGCTVEVPDGQTCCGQPAWNAGFHEEAATVARTSLDALEGALGAGGCDAVVVPAGSCATMIRVFWPEVFELVGDDDVAERARIVARRTYELGEFLASHADRLPPLSLDPPQTVAYHHSCHMLRELRIDHAPLDLLDRVAGCERVEWPADQRCCGFGGLFSMKLPETSEVMADEKLEAFAATGAGALVGSDGSCLLHLRSRADHEGRPIRARHLAEVLDDALPPEGTT